MGNYLRLLTGNLAPPVFIGVDVIGEEVYGTEADLLEQSERLEALDERDSVGNIWEDFAGLPSPSIHQSAAEFLIKFNEENK